MDKHTPGPWWVRTREVGGEVVDCFVAAKDVQGCAYDAEILGDDEYRDGIERKLADCRLIAAAPELLDAARELRQRQRDYLSQPKGERDEAKGRLVGSAAEKLDAAIAKATGASA